MAIQTGLAEIEVYKNGGLAPHVVHWRADARRAMRGRITEKDIYNWNLKENEVLVYEKGEEIPTIARVR